MSLTDQQQADAAAALAVFDRYIKVVNAANENPGAKDWTKDIRTVAADPNATEVLQSLQSLKSAEVRELRHSAYGTPTILSVTPKRIDLRICEDARYLTLLNKNGSPANKPQAVAKRLFDVTVYKYAPKDGGWLVGETQYAEPVAKC